jgi:hypothetical protein
VALATERGTSEDDPNARLIAGMSIVIVREAFGSMPLMFLSAIVAYGLLAFCIKALTITLIRTNYAGVVASLPELNMNFLLVLVLLLCQNLVLACVAIAMHRLILLDETQRGTIFPFSWRVLLFTAWLFVVRLPTWFMIALSPFVYSPVHAVKTVASFLVVGLIVALIVSTVRLGLIFPAIAIDAPSESFLNRVAVAWRLSRHRFWRLWSSTWLALLAMLAVVIGVTVVLVIVLAIAHELIPPVIAQLSLLASAITIVFSAALIAASLSWNYRIVTGRPAPPDLRST